MKQEIDQPPAPRRRGLGCWLLHHPSGIDSLRHEGAESTLEPLEGFTVAPSPLIEMPRFKRRRLGKARQCGKENPVIHQHPRAMYPVHFLIGHLIPDAGGGDKRRGAKPEFLGASPTENIPGPEIEDLAHGLLRSRHVIEAHMFDIKFGPEILATLQIALELKMDEVKATPLPRAEMNDLATKEFNLLILDRVCQRVADHQLRGDQLQELLRQLKGGGSNRRHGSSNHLSI